MIQDPGPEAIMDESREEVVGLLGQLDPLQHPQAAQYAIASPETISVVLPTEVRPRPRRATRPLSPAPPRRSFRPSRRRWPLAPSLRAAPRSASSRAPAARHVRLLRDAVAKQDDRRAQERSG